MLNKELSFISKMKYQINQNVSTGGSITISPSGKQYKDTLITITCSADTNSQFNSISITKSNGENVSYTTVTSGKTYTFIMPSSNVTVNVSFGVIPTYTITCQSSGPGSCRASKTTAKAGESITIYSTENINGFRNRIEVSGVGSSTSSSYSFKMPANNVTATAYFDSAGSQSITAIVSVNASTDSGHWYIYGTTSGEVALTNGSEFQLALTSGVSKSITITGNGQAQESTEISINFSDNAKGSCIFEAYTSRTRTANLTVYAKSGVSTVYGSCSVDIA